MSRRRAHDLDDAPLGGVTVEHLKSAIAAEVGPVKTELRWQRMIGGILLMTIFGPKIAQLPVIAMLSDPGTVAHMVALTRVKFGH